MTPYLLSRVMIIRRLRIYRFCLMICLSLHYDSLYQKPSSMSTHCSNQTHRRSAFNTKSTMLSTRSALQIQRLDVTIPYAGKCIIQYTFRERYASALYVQG
jgi:hypothetical protein